MHCQNEYVKSSIWAAMLALYVTIAGIEKLPMIITTLGNDVRLLTSHVYLCYNALPCTGIPVII